MSLNEGTFVGKNAVADALKDPEFKALKSDEKTKAIATLKQGGSVTTEIEEANAYLAAADAARDKGEKEFEFPKGSGKMHKVTLKRNLDLEEGKLSTALGGVAVLAGLLLMNKINSNDPVIQRLQAEYEQADPAQQDSIQKLITKRLVYLDSGDFDSETPMDEAKTKIAKTLFGNRIGYETPFKDFVEDLKYLKDWVKGKKTIKSDDSKKLVYKLTKLEKGELDKDEFEAFIKDLARAGYSKDELKRLRKKYNDAVEAKNKNAVKEEKTIELPADTTFTLDLKHLMKKHMDEGKSQEEVVKLTKALMKKLHDKGKVKVNGTKVIFKEIARPPGGSLTHKDKLANLSPEEKEKYLKNLENFSDFENLDLGGIDEQDVPLALPKAPAKDFLGDDGKDYEGGMAKSQMLKMKKYADALCNMIDDESQLEAWVQAKLTKASDYMSAVYHYLDYQNSKIDENLNPSMQDTDEALVSILMGVTRLGQESAEQVIDNLTAEDFKKAAMMMMREVDEREIAKFILSATKLDEISKVNEDRLVPKDEWEQLDIEWEMTDYDENRFDFQSGPLHGTTPDGREFESYGYYTEFEGLVVDDDVYEI